MLAGRPEPPQKANAEVYRKTGRHDILFIPSRIKYRWSTMLLVRVIYPDRAVQLAFSGCYCYFVFPVNTPISIECNA